MLVTHMLLNRVLSIRMSAAVAHVVLLFSHPQAHQLVGQIDVAPQATSSRVATSSLRTAAAALAASPGAVTFSDSTSGKLGLHIGFPFFI